MNILITGGAGFIGSNLVKNLLKTTTHSITVIDRDTVNIDYLLNKVTKDLRPFSIINADYADCCDEFLTNNKIDVVIHLAAIPRVAFSVEHPSSTTLENVYKTVHLLKACHKNISKFVFASSSSVYGGADILPTSETCPLNPKSPLG